MPRTNKETSKKTMEPETSRGNNAGGSKPAGDGNVQRIILVDKNNLDESIKTLEKNLIVLKNRNFNRFPELNKDSVDLKGLKLNFYRRPEGTDPDEVRINKLDCRKFEFIYKDIGKEDVLLFKQKIYDLLKKYEFTHYADKPRRKETLDDILDLTYRRIESNSETNNDPESCKTYTVSDSSPSLTKREDGYNISIFFSSEVKLGSSKPIKLKELPCMVKYSSIKERDKMAGLVIKKLAEHGFLGKFKNKTERQNAISAKVKETIAKFNMIEKSMGKEASKFFEF